MDINLNPYTAESAAIQRRLQMAQLLNQQAMQPMEMPQQAGVKISPYAGLAKILEGFNAGREEKAATEAYKELANKYQAGNQADISGFLQAMQGSPAKELAGPAPQGAPTGVSPEGMQGGYIQPAQAPDRQRAMALALGSQNPTLQSAGGHILSQMMTPKQPIHVAPGGSILDPNTMQPVYTAPKERVPNAAEAEYNLAKQEGYKGSFVEFLQNVKRTPPNQNVTYGSPVAAVSADGKPVFIQPGKGGGAPSVIEGFSPPAEKLRPIPPSINTAIIENQKSGNQLDRAISLLSGQDLPGMVADKNATGLKGYLPTGLLNRLDPSGVSARAEIADIGSLKIHDRSGSAVTVSESPRLMPFIPLTTDDRDTVLKKLQRLKLEIDSSSAAMKEIYSTEQGYRENPILNKPSVNEKITSMQEIQDVATKTGKSVEQVKQDALAKGYKVQ
ncbi:hypothetical protein UFOVP102_2 [uncultured Caudovirales phage]|uniref:Uncharacterized protein n=1 Tax=uncultured Caudovirales phage TaxID=2100421 RepID=A0A6J5L3U8_9CAUD|nr:hypothetical protein UFOVP102_2 [uncultured Caudovirales phage]